MNLTQSYGQTGKQNPDTVKCYGLTELRYIAATLVEAKTCDTLLSIAKIKLINREKFIREKDIEISALNKQIMFKDSVITDKNNEITKINLHLQTEKNKRKWTNYGWAATSFIFTALIVYLSVR